MLKRTLSFLVLAGTFCLPNAAEAQMFCRETLSDTKHKVQVSVCVTDVKRELIVHVKNLDIRTKQVVFANCVVDLTSIGGGKHQSGVAVLTVSQNRPNNRHVIAAQLLSRVATDFRSVDTKWILCIYDVKVLDEQATTSPASLRIGSNGTSSTLARTLYFSGGGLFPVEPS
jgi:hypothetical protein